LLPECVGRDSHGKILSAPDEQLVISFNWKKQNKTKQRNLMVANPVSYAGTKVCLWT